MDELIQKILGNGTRGVITEEPVLDGHTRPLTIRYTSEDGTVVESIEYAEPPDSRAWGAIKSINHEMIEYDPQLQAVILDRRFGEKMINEYLKENKALNLTPAQSLQQLQKFAAIKAMFEVGAIGAGTALLQAVEPDEIFTQDRKDAFLYRILSRK